MPGIMFNQDCSDFFVTHGADEMTADGIDRWVAVWAGTQIHTLLFNPNASRSVVATEQRQTLWDGFDPQLGNDQPFFAGTVDHRGGWLDAEGGARARSRQCIENMFLMHQRGIDYIGQSMVSARKHRISPWLSIRMNDIHNVEEPENCSHDRFWRDHPEWRRIPRRGNTYEGGTLDYARPEVRAYQMAYIREMVNRYDLDGLELDWMRFPGHFRPGCEEAGATLLTEFIAEIRELLKSRAAALGHSIKLAARVPPMPEHSLGMGLDAASWANRGLIDLLIVAPFLFCQTEIPIETWKQLLDGTGVRLAAGLEITLRAYEGGRQQCNSLETTRGIAGSFLDRGADEIYLFNYFPKPAGSAVYNDIYKRLVTEIGSAGSLRGKARRHVVVNADAFSFPSGETAPRVLPAKCAPGGRVEFRMPIGPAPAQEQLGQVRLELEKLDPAAAAMIPVYVNDQQCRFASVTDSAAVFDIPPKALHRGHNVVEVENASKNDLSITWLEIAISGPEGQWSVSDVESRPLDLIE